MKNVIVSVLYSAAVLCALFVGLGAFAQEAVQPVLDPVAATIIDVKEVGALAAAGKWTLAVIAALMLALRFARGPVMRMLPETSAFVVWSKGTVGGWVWNFTASELASLSTYFATVSAATPVSVAGVVGAVLGGALLAFGGAGAHEFSKDVGLGPKSVGPKPAPVVTATQAASTLELPPR